MDSKPFDCGSCGVTLLSTAKSPAKKITTGRYAEKVLITDLIINIGFNPLIESYRKPAKSAIGENKSPTAVSSQ